LLATKTPLPIKSLLIQNTHILRFKDSVGLPTKDQYSYLKIRAFGSSFIPELFKKTPTPLSLVLKSSNSTTQLKIAKIISELYINPTLAENRNKPCQILNVNLEYQ